MNNQKGFTLIEMLVVIAIVGLLSSVVVVGLGGARQKARDARRVADIRQIQNALEIEYDTAYPGTIPGGVTVTDPTGATYSYELSLGGQSYRVGGCLETDTEDTGKTNCPSALACTPAYYFCASPGAFVTPPAE